ncbi:hypothetical protein CHS0354_020458 [Potamilus streckersoni]|uniref:Mitochondria-eating protein n=1 Tax=Potamilus streckersoni TaxID=2493646 RepID=A0AAE0TC25_9BIVA|nr:hypothetical protein CHS0354_020458 [Potamilus streckersoni]
MILFSVDDMSWTGFQETMRSENASILLHDNNPNIADLSDPNRPTKLAERFSALYSNEHTDTFEELAKCHHDGLNGEDQEKKIVKDLLCVVKHAYDHCQKWNEDIENMLETQKQTTNPKSEDEIIQLKGLLLERKQKLVKDKTDDVVKTFMGKTVPNISPRHVSEKAKTKYKNYAKATVEVVWWMCVKNPPIHLEYAESGPFHSDFYRSYTKSGQFVDFGLGH